MSWRGRSGGRRLPTVPAATNGWVRGSCWSKAATPPDTCGRNSRPRREVSSQASPSQLAVDAVAVEQASVSVALRHRAAHPCLTLRSSWTTCHTGLTLSCHRDVQRLGPEAMTGSTCGVTVSSMTFVGPLRSADNTANS